MTVFAGSRYNVSDFYAPKVDYAAMGATATMSDAAEFGEAILGKASERNAELLAEAEVAAAQSGYDASQAEIGAYKGMKNNQFISGLIDTGFQLGGAAISKFGNFNQNKLRFQDAFNQNQTVPGKRLGIGMS
tara:strand:+ start:461 stop:856 length:396 start_codon:yes stop_codon:yes gene_type:complete